MALQAATDREAGGLDYSKTLDLEMFWGKPTPYPRVPLEKWKRRFIVALLAKTMISFEEIRHYYREPQLFYPPQEAAPLDKTETKNQEELRMARNKEKKQHAKDMYDREWNHWKNSSASGLNLSAANARATAILFMMLGAEGQRWYEQKRPHDDITTMQFDELRHLLDEVFHIKQNVSVERFKFLSRRQGENETLEHFHSALTALAARCQLRDLERELVRDLFITNICDLELQREYLRKELSATEVLETALAWERGKKDQGSITQTVRQKQTSTSILPGALNPNNASAGNQEASSTQTVKTEPVNAVQRSAPERRNTRSTQQDCRNCGNQFGPNHQPRDRAVGSVASMTILHVCADLLRVATRRQNEDRRTNEVADQTIGHQNA